MRINHIKSLISDLKNDLADAITLKDMSEIWHKYLGKNGSIKIVLKEIKELPLCEKKSIASLVQGCHKMR